MSGRERARHAAEIWISVLMELTEAEQREEIRQIMFDAMDATEQSGIDGQLVRALDAFDGKPTGAQGPFRDMAEKDRDRLRQAVSIFLRHRAKPTEKLEVFNESAVKALQAALSQSYEPEEGSTKR